MYGTVGNTLASDLIQPELLAEAVRAGLPGALVMGRTGAVRIETGLPEGSRGGQVIQVPYFGSIGEMKDYADGDPIEVRKITQSGETSTIIRSGIAFNLTDFARRVTQYADPYAEGAQQINTAIAARINRAAVVSASAVLPAKMVKDVYNATVPVKPSRNLFISAKMLWGDEQDMIVAGVAHSFTVQNLLLEVDGNGQPMNKLLRHDPVTGVYEFEGMPPMYCSDITPVTFPVTSAGTSPPAVTLSGDALGQYTPRIEITTGGVRGTALFRWSLNNGSTWEQTDVATNASVTLGESGLVATFATGTYSTDNVYTSVPKYCTMLLKAGAIVAWIEPPNAEDFRDPLRKATISATELLHVSHRYNRLAGKTRGGVVHVFHNN